MAESTSSASIIERINRLKLDNLSSSTGASRIERFTNLKVSSDEALDIAMEMTNVYVSNGAERIDDEKLDERALDDASKQIPNIDSREPPLSGDFESQLVETAREQWSALPTSVPSRYRIWATGSSVAGGSAAAGVKRAASETW